MAAVEGGEQLAERRLVVNHAGDAHRLDDQEQTDSAVVQR